MRYHYEKPEMYTSIYGEVYECDHLVYSRCTLFKIGDKALAVIQQRYDPVHKTTRWTEIDPWLVDDLYLHPNFYKYFEGRATTGSDGLYPTVTIRQLMWSLKMKPLPKERWETTFDRRNI